MHNLKIKMEGIIFRNSKRYINEGIGLGQGILFCGDKYTNDGGCPCGNCVGHCGPNKGCSCPDCEYTLSYLLYSTGKMNCGICKKTLIRINIFNLKNILKSKTNMNPTFRCNICNKFYSNETFIPLMHCMKCNYNMCPKCAFSKLTTFEFEIPKLELGFNLGLGMIYCQKNYTESGFCLCGGCDGNCGPENGCPCPLCDAILGYNIYLKSNFMKCKCNRLLVKTTTGLLKKISNKYQTSCLLCNHELDKNDFQVIYHCYKCKKNLCKQCAYKNNILDIKNIVFPKTPISLENMEKIIREKIKKEKTNEFKIIKQKRFLISTKKEKEKNISVYLKTILGTIYTISIDENEYISKLKEELRKLDKKYLENKTILIYQNRKLEDYDNFKELGIGDESLINAILK